MAITKNIKKPRPSGHTLEDDGMPSSVASEKAILGAIILENDLYYDAAIARVQAPMFYLDAHRKIYRAIIDLMENKRPVNTLSLMEELSQRQELKSVNGVPYLSSLTDGVPRRDSIVHFTKIIIDKAMLRDLIFAANGIIARAVSDSRPASEILEEAEAAVMNLGAERSGELVKHIREVGPRVMKKLYEMSKMSRDTIALGMTTTIAKLDTLSTGLQRKQMSVLGAYQKDGKTSLMTQVILANAWEGHPWLIFSHESDDESIYKRMLSMISGVPFSRIRDPRELVSSLVETEDEWKMLEKAAADLNTLPIHIEDESSMDIQTIKAVTRVWARKHGIHGIAVDFLQKVKAPQAPDRRLEVTAVSEGLRQLAKDEDLHVMALSQLVKPEKGIKKPPTMFDFRESSGPLDDCHLALAPYRPVDGDNHFTGRDEIIILAQREGIAGVSVPVKYDTGKLIFEQDDARVNQQHRDDG